MKIEEDINSFSDQFRKGKHAADGEDNVTVSNSMSSKFSDIIFEEFEKINLDLEPNQLDEIEDFSFVIGDMKGGKTLNIVTHSDKDAVSNAFKNAMIAYCKLYKHPSTAHYVAKGKDFKGRKVMNDMISKLQGKLFRKMGSAISNGDDWPVALIKILFLSDKTSATINEAFVKACKCINYDITKINSFAKYDLFVGNELNFSLQTKDIVTDIKRRIKVAGVPEDMKDAFFGYLISSIKLG